MNAMKQFLARSARLVMSRRIWVAVGVLAVVAALWLIGPLIAIGVYRPLETASARIWATAAIGILWIGRKAWLRWRAARVNAELLTRLHEPAATVAGGVAEQAPHVRELRSRFDEAVSLLKSARLGNVESHSSAARWTASLLLARRSAIN